MSGGGTRATDGSEAAVVEAAVFESVVLAGGRGSRLGGVDKAAVLLRETRLVDRVLAAARAAGARRCVVVGPESAGELADAVVREDPPFAGPLAALAAGLAAVREEWVLLLPCDLEHPGPVCAALTGALPARGPDGIRLLDTAGRPQWLAGVYRASALRAGIDALGGRTADRPLRLAFAAARVREVRAPEGATADIDTAEDLERARRERHRDASASLPDGADDAGPRHTVTDDRGDPR
ncbi:NTP transferase domain-containing protein [Leucobacter sp. CSA1]|uniref:NTP transferase domain-containing protein n=1 Tax=Leucobacter chromiisoli TaxID=2796471 RepID=A0A934Q5W4_9MICO|nr:NTP transferase domain-containing protein [Leucobacter chromiisoli]MBK0417631.1 NTP transferase domain-containing protein [Leucobacter chromiisoli]